MLTISERKARTPHASALVHDLRLRDAYGPLTAFRQLWHGSQLLRSSYSFSPTEVTDECGFPTATKRRTIVALLSAGAPPSNTNTG
jgi:hypothetical protein